MSKIGDIYKITKGVKVPHYIQLVALDLPNMNSDVVIVTRENPLEVEPTKENILFYTHTSVDVGNKMLWEKIGNIAPTIEATSLPFKIYRDETVGKVEQLTDPLSITVPFPNWYVWTPADDDFYEVSEDEGFSMKIEEGGIRPPEDIIYRINHGESEFKFIS